jgi:hypothetical protein
MNDEMDDTTVDVLIDSGVFETSTAYGLDRTYAVAIRGVTHDKIRVRVRRDQIDSQSTFTAHSWRPDGWSLVTQIHGEHPDAQAMPAPGVFRMNHSWRDGKNGHDDCVAAAERVAKRLLDDALLVLL